MRVRLADITRVIRSKNAGPGQLTLDIIFLNSEWFGKVVASGAIDQSRIARIYGVDEAHRVRIIPYPPAAAIKITLPRRVISGDVGDTDIYGAQQHAPLLALVLEGLE